MAPHLKDPATAELFVSSSFFLLTLAINGILISRSYYCTTVLAAFHLHACVLHLAVQTRRAAPPAVRDVTVARGEARGGAALQLFYVSCAQE